MSRDNWTSPDILARFRWRLAFYKLGWAMIWLGAVAGIFVAFSKGLGVGVGVGVWIASMVAALIPMLAASTCLNCGANMRYASLRNGFNCWACGAVHHHPERYVSGLAPSKGLVLPDGIEKAWLYPPLMEAYTARHRRARIGMVLFLLGVVFLVGWIMAMKTNWNPLPINPHTYLGLFGAGLVAGLVLHFGASRCPHCKCPLVAGNDGHTSPLATWCGWCGAVLLLTPEAKRAFLPLRRVVAQPPHLREPETVDELIDEANRLRRDGDHAAASAVIGRALQRYPHSGKVADWLMR